MNTLVLMNATVDYLFLCSFFDWELAFLQCTCSWSDNNYLNN